MTFGRREAKAEITRAREQLRIWRRYGARLEEYTQLLCPICKFCRGNQCQFAMLPVTSDGGACNYHQYKVVPDG